TIKTPMTFGLFQPKILLPANAQNWSQEQLKIVLLHELAHIKRHDYLLHLIGLLTLSIFWFHPLVWLLQKWQQSEREKACDEYVLKQGISKTNYAESLVKIARNMLSKKAHRWHSSLPMAASSETKKRVLAILKFDLQQWQFTRWMKWRWIGFFACVLPLLAAIHPAAKELMEESIPKIEAVLEQPVFVPKAEVEEVEIIAKEELQNAHLDKDRIGVELIDTIARLPVPAIQQMNTQPYLPIIKSHQHKVQEEKILGYYGKWDNYNNRYVQVFTKGEFEVDKEYPYFKNLSEGALIVIQLSDKMKIGGMYNRREQRLIIKKATYNAWVKKNHTASDAAIKQGELLFSWSAYSKRKSATVFSNQARELHFVSNQSKVDQEDWRLWMREDIKEVANMMRRFEDQEIWKEVSEEQPQKQWNMVVASSEFTFHQCLEPMSEEDRKIRDQQRPLLNKEALQEFLEKSKMDSLNTTEGKALYGKWEEENRIIEIWTRGDFDVQSGFPYFVNLSPKNLIIIRKRAKGKGKKCCEELFIQRLPFYGRLGKKDGIPISRGENIYTYKGENWRKIGYTLTSSSYGGFKFSDKKKTYRETLRDWKEMGIADLVQKMQTDANFLQPIKEGTWHWEQMTNTDAGVPGLGHILYTSEEEWQKIVQAYEVKQTLGKQKNKDQANLIQLPDRYVYIPSGQLKSVVKDGETEQTIQGFHMSETEITNRQ
ncbi:MAG: M56 family metallopeptidase, partial [Bacteroidota bacterium]